jgi:RNA polymerase sigma-70 factor (ECF subfamily)
MFKRVSDTAHKGCSPDVFVCLLEATEAAVYNLCYRMLGEEEEAEDAAQETFLRAYRQFHRYDPSRPFQPWVFAIACHHCFDRLRRRKLMVWLRADDEFQHPAWREPSPSPEDMVLQSEQSERIQELLDRLSPKDRAVIVLRYWYDFSDKEIAQATGTTTSAVKSRICRARKALAEDFRSKLASDTGASANLQNTPNAYPVFR